MDQFQNLIVEKNDGITLLVLNRPKQLNALNKDLLGELNAAFEALRDDTDTKVVILTGSGEKAFVAGANGYVVKGAETDVVLSGISVVAKNEVFFSSIEML